MNRSITSEETKKLFEFCSQHFVYHYDMQVELVDHLASSIEEQWQKNQEIPFKNALFNTFKKFGIHGFSKIKEQKQKELTRKYNILLWKYLFEFFSWPKIVMTLAFTFVLTTALKIAENDLWVIVPYFGIITLFIFYYYVRIFPERYNISKINGKKFMLLEQLKRAQYTSILFVQIPLHLINFRNILNTPYLQNDIGIMAVSLIIVLLTIATFGGLFYVPEKIKEHFKMQFPEFAL